MPNDSKPKGKITLDSIISDLIAESIKSSLTRRALDEKEKQVVTKKSGKDDASGDNNDDKAPSATVKADKEDIEAMKKVPDYKDIVEKLNTIRSGKSLKDPDIESTFKQYIDSLTDAEKVALFVFLKGVGQILSGEFPADAAIDPGDDPARVSMKKAGGSDSGAKTRSIKPNIIKQPIPAGDKPVKKSGAENTEPPIQVKKK